MKKFSMRIKKNDKPSDRLTDELAGVEAEALQRGDVAKLTELASYYESKAWLAGVMGMAKGGVR